MFLSFRKYQITDNDEINSIWRPNIQFELLQKYETSKFYGVGKPFTLGYRNYGYGPMIMYGEEIQLKFSCEFHFENYPFDSHVCKMAYGSQTLGSNKMAFNSSKIVYENRMYTLEDEPIILQNLPYPFEFKLDPLPAFLKSDPNEEDSFSFTGMVIKMRRTSLGCGINLFLKMVRLGSNLTFFKGFANLFSF